MNAFRAAVFGLVAGAAFGFAPSAWADGMDRKRVSYDQAPLLWSGFYVGINGGYGFAANEQTVTNTETVNTVFSARGNFGSLDIAGGFAGVQIGYNARVGGLVLGIEADIQGADISDSSRGTVNNFLPGLNATVTTSNEVEMFGTVRPRLGFLWDNALIYGTGGFAWGSIKHSHRFSDNFNFIAEDERRTGVTGYVLGGGIEYAFSPRLSLKAEYQYIDLGSIHYTTPLFFKPAAVKIPTLFAEHTDVRTDFHTVRLGLNYKLDGPDASYQSKGRIVTYDSPRNWGGFYLGLHGGLLWSEHDVSFTGGNPALQIAAVNGKGFLTNNDSPIFGGQVGWQLQFGQAVVGVEGTLSTTFGEKNNEQTCPRQVIALFNCSARLNDLSTVGGRLGWAMGNWMPFASGGYAYGTFTNQVTNQSLVPVGAVIIDYNNRSDGGWYVGGGADWAVADGWTVGFEYRHYDFGHQAAIATAVVGGVSGTPLPNDNASFNVTADTVTLRANWRFGAP